MDFDAHVLHSIVSLANDGIYNPGELHDVLH